MILIISFFYQNRGNRLERRGPLLPAEHRLPRSQALPRRGWRHHLRHRQERHGQLWLELHLIQTLWNFVSSEKVWQLSCWPGEPHGAGDRRGDRSSHRERRSQRGGRHGKAGERGPEIGFVIQPPLFDFFIKQSNSLYILLEQPNMISCCRWWTWWSPWSRLSPPRWARDRSQPTTSTPTTRQTSSQNFKINKFFQNCSFCDSRYCRQHGWSKKSPHHIRVSSYTEFLNKFKLVAFCILWQTVFRNSTKRANFGAFTSEINFA